MKCKYPVQEKKYLLQCDPMHARGQESGLVWLVALVFVFVLSLAHTEQCPMAIPGFILWGITLGCALKVMWCQGSNLGFLCAKNAN